jgi:ribosomal-protein-alanine N-acetyltransferase
MPVTRSTHNGVDAFHRDDPEVRIRPVKVEDLAELISVDQEAFGSLAYPTFVLSQFLDVHRDCLLVAEQGEGLIGYSLATPTLDRSESWLLALGVRKAFQGQGHGRRLLVASLATLRKEGISTFRLTVDPDNAHAIRLYKSEGFVVQKMVLNRLGPGEDRLDMTMSDQS